MRQRTLFQKQRHMDFVQEMLTTFNYDPDLLKKVITGHESWVYGCDIETKAELSQWKRLEETRPKETRQVQSNVFSDCNGMVHHEFLPQGRTISKKYKQFLRKFLA